MADEWDEPQRLPPEFWHRMAMAHWGQQQPDHGRFAFAGGMGRSLWGNDLASYGLGQYAPSSLALQPNMPPLPYTRGAGAAGGAAPPPRSNQGGGLPWWVPAFENLQEPEMGGARSLKELRQEMMMSGPRWKYDVPF